MSQSNYVIQFFNNEPVRARNGSGDARTRKITASTVLSASLSWDVRFVGTSVLSAFTFKGVKFNGEKLSGQMKGSTDVTQLIVRNGDNTVLFDYDSDPVQWLLNSEAFIVTVNLSIVAVGDVGQQVPSSNGSGFSLPWWAWAVVAVLVLGVLAWFLTQTKVGGKLGKAASDTAHSVADAVKGAVQ